MFMPMPVPYILRVACRVLFCSVMALDLYTKIRELRQEKRKGKKK